MILSRRVRRCYLALHGVDFRKQHNGLLAEAYKLELDPFNGDLLIFVARNRRRIKVLYADDAGLWLSTKLFTEAMKTKLRFLFDPKCAEITQGELAMIVEGAAYLVQNRVSAYLPETL